MSTLAAIGKAYRESRAHGERRTQQRAARQLCLSFGHSYMQAVSNGLLICVYCGHSTLPSAAALALVEGETQ